MAQKEVIRSMEARTGRVEQRYGPDGTRLVAGVVALSNDKKKVLLVQSTKRSGHWVLPKGGYETDEDSPEEAAAREAWEEAGITGKIIKSLGEIKDPRPHRSKPNKEHIHPALYMFFEFSVEKEEVQWPEMDTRRRKWMTFSEATECFMENGRTELKEALDKSSIIRI